MMLFDNGKNTENQIDNEIDEPRNNKIDKTLDKAIKEKKKETQDYYASQGQLMWRHFKKHRIAMVALLVIVIIYLLAIFCGFFSPYTPQEYDRDKMLMPPQVIHFGYKGNIFRPFVYGYDVERDPVTLRKLYELNPEEKYPIYFFARGSEYKLMGLIKTNIHLIGTDQGYLYLLGADNMGRDLLTRILYGARISTSIGFIGVILTFAFGIVIGGFAGYYGGFVDNIVQRFIELLRSIPTIPLWMGLSAALPSHWSPIRVYLGITIILSLLGWTGLARVVRSKFLSLREEQFVMAARLSGNSEFRIIIKHMLPNFFSHIIASLTLAIPGMILGETSLSFLGIGLRPPVVSWGVLLKAAQNVRTLAFAPWLLLPGVAVIITVLAFNFLGDGIRDAADPFGYGR